MLLSQKCRFFRNNVYRTLDIISPNDTVLISLSLHQYSDIDIICIRATSMVIAKKLYISGTVVALELRTSPLALIIVRIIVSLLNNEFYEFFQKENLKNIENR